VDIRIGVVQSGKEIDVDLGDKADAAKLVKEIESVLGDDTKVLWLTDRKGRKVGIPSARVAYVEITPHEDRRVGFGAH
jgi:methyl coenzyme M reductase beta subunit